MSGPITVAFSFGPLGAVILAAEAMREAQAMGQEYAQALENVQARENALAATRRQQRSALAQQNASLEQEVARNERRLERLQGICDALGKYSPQNAGQIQVAAFQRPTSGNQDALIEYANAVRKEIERIEALLAQAGADFSTQRRAGAGEVTSAPDLDEALNAYALQRSLQPGLSPEQAEIFRNTAKRVLKRIELTGNAILPHDLEALAGEIVLASSVERAEELAAELRLRVQRYREERVAQQLEAEQAQNLLEALQDDVPAELRAILERVVSGAERLDAATRQSAQRLQTAAQEARERQEQQAAAVVLEQSLRDLGYEVEGVENTLFVEGGVVHFQRQGWENYFVRLRLDPQEKTINFNVVRPRGGEESAARKRQDTLAEDRWCAEFPQLLKTLAARGLHFDVTRQLGAGELPVQAVDPASLPQARAEEDRSRTGNKPLQKGWP